MYPHINIVGKYFGRWYVIRQVKMPERKDPMWLCKCSCGTTRCVRGISLRNGTSVSCGCFRVERVVESIQRRGDYIIGRRFGRWVVLRRAQGNVKGVSQWMCRCNCGVERVIGRSVLVQGISKSCGCYRIEIRTTHGDTRSNRGRMVSTKEYRVWANMKERCTNPNHPKYSDYGGRGIRVCKRWLYSYTTFLRDIGRAPSPEHTIDRKNNNGNYTPSNCRWATMKEQNNNQRRTAA